MYSDCKILSIYLCELPSAIQFQNKSSELTRHMKRILLIIFLSFTFSAGEAQNLPWINFNWVGDTVSGRYFDKLAMIVPVQIDAMPYKFVAQLDLGAVTTMLYGNAIQPYLDENKALGQKVDTSASIWIQNQKNPSIKGVNLKLDQVLFPNLNVALFIGFGDALTRDSINTKTVKHIGTIAPDLFQNKILIIDYPNRRFCVVE